MSDIATPGPISPADGQPDHRAEVSALKDWFRQNVVSLALTVAAVVAVFLYLDPVDTLKVVIGLGLVIFIHELGHFLAAKWCDVHVKTFSIGFGPAVPFCSYKWGETTYMVGVVPLGGYVSMVGEGTGETLPDADPDDDRDPRSFKNKSVGARMLIISAGVIMNVILGMGCFAAAYLHGVREEPAVVGAVESGGAAWKAGLGGGDEITKIGSRDNPTFKELRTIVISTGKGEEVPVRVNRDGKALEFRVEPLRAEGAYFPQLGITSKYQATLLDNRKRRGFRPALPGTPAAAADAFEGGDRIVAMSDPATYPAVTPLPVVSDPVDPSRRATDYDEYHRRMVLLADKDVTFHVLRKGQPDDAPPTAIVVKPAYRSDLGLRMRMGEVVAVRAGGPAALAGVRVRNEEASPPVRGDKIVAVGVTDAGGRRTWYAAGGKRPDEAGPADEVRPLDPVTLPIDLEKWAASFPADRQAGLKVDLIVLREAENTEKRVLVPLEYDPGHRFDREVVTQPNSPLPVPGLGLGYWVEAVVDGVEPGSPAAAAGLRPNDVVEAVRYKSEDADGAVSAGPWDDLKPHQWAYAEAAFQSRPPYEVDLRVKRADGGATEEVTVRGRPDTARPTADRGLLFQPDTRTVQATDAGDAVYLGARRTVRFVKEVYMNLYGYLRGRISTKTLSGPLSIANAAYKIAGEDFWQFLLFLGMISVNLAVVNFLPIPVLDGGHMVFLVIEKVIGRPVPERLFGWAMGIGLFLILALFVFVIRNDVMRLLGWI